METQATEGALRLVPPLSNLSSLSQVSRPASARRSTTPTNGKAEGGLQNALVGVEERLNAQISRVQQQGERLREVALSRMEAKVGAVEALQPKVDRRMAELSGSVKGLSDEMQSQLRRVDQIDSKLWDWRHQLEEELRSRLVEVEQSLQQLGSAQRVAKAAAEDAAKKVNMRLLRLEGLAEEHHSHAEDTNGSLAQLNLRLEELEESHGLQHVHHDEAIYANVEKIRVREAEWQLQQTALEERFLEHSLSTQGLQQKFDVMQQESSDLRARLEVQEEKLKALRTLQDTKDEQLRSLIDRVERENLEGRLKSVQQRVQELESAQSGHTEQLQLIQHSLDRQEQDVQHLSRLPSPRHQPLEEQQVTPSRGLHARLEKLEDQLSRVSQSVQALESEQSLTPHMSALVDRLKEITPKVISHDHDLQMLRSEVAAMKQRSEHAPQVSQVPQATAPVLQEPLTETPAPSPEGLLEVSEANGAMEAAAPSSPTPSDEEVGSPQRARAEWQLQQAAKRCAIP